MSKVAIKIFPGIRGLTAFMLRMLPARWRRMTTAILLALCEVGAVILAPLLGARIINALAGYQWESFRYNLLLLGLLTVATMGIVFARKYVVITIDERVGNNLRQGLLDAVLRKRLPFFERHWAGDIIARVVNDTSLLKPFLTGILLQIIVDIATLLVVICLLLWMNPALALLTMASAPISLIYGWKTRPRLEASSQQIREAVANLTGQLQSWLSRPFALKVHSLEGEASRRFAGKSSELEAHNVRLGTLTAVIEALNTLLLGIPSLLIFGYGGYVTLSGRLSVGELFAFMTYASYFGGPIQRLITINLVALPTLYPAERRIREFIGHEEQEAPEEFPVARERLAAALELSAQDLRFSFDSGPNYTLSVPAFSARRGEVVGITGANGSGKSTLVRLLTALYWPQQGSITLRLEDGSELTPPERRFLGILPQEPALFDGTLLENVTLFDATPERGRITEIENTLGLRDWLSTLPKGWETVVNAGLATTFSGGQMQKIGLARLLHSGRPVLILDEPANGLDEAAQLSLRHALSEVKHDRIIIIITHSSDALSLCDRVYRLRYAGDTENSYECVEMIAPEVGLRERAVEHLARHVTT